MFCNISLDTVTLPSLDECTGECTFLIQVNVVCHFFKKYKFSYKIDCSEILILIFLNIILYNVNFYKFYLKFHRTKTHLYIFLRNIFIVFFFYKSKQIYFPYFLDLVRALVYYTHKSFEIEDEISFRLNQTNHKKINN